MRLTLIAVFALLAAPLVAEHVVGYGRPGEPVIIDVAAATGKRPYDGPHFSGKPPPLGAPDDRGSLDSVAPSSADRLPSAGTRPVSSGSGFVVAPGRVLTNNHVVDECGTMVARNSRGARSPARVLATDRRRDLALLSVLPDTGPPLTFREAPPVHRGEAVITYGFPLQAWPHPARP